MTIITFPHGQARCPAYHARTSPPGASPVVCDSSATRYPQRRCKRSGRSCRKRLFAHPTGRTNDGSHLLAGRLTKDDLAINAHGRVVSRRKSELGKRAYETSPLREWNAAARAVVEAVSRPYSEYGIDPLGTYAPFVAGSASAGYANDFLPPPPSPAADGRRKSARTKRPILAGELSYHGTSKWAAPRRRRSRPRSARKRRARSGR
jgi:hypothetical protein